MHQSPSTLVAVAISDLSNAARSDVRVEACVAEVLHTLQKLLASPAPSLMPLTNWIYQYRQILDRRGLSAATLSNREAAIRRIVRELGHIGIGLVRTYDLAQLVEAHMTENHPHAARNMRTVLRDVFAEAAAAGVIDIDPTHALRAPRAATRRRRLRLEDWRQIRAAAPSVAPWLVDAMDLALVTGQRRGDLAALRRADIQPGFLHVRQEKTGARLLLDLDIRLAAIGQSIGDVVERCLAAGGETLICHRQARGIRAGAPVHTTTLSRAFAAARDLVIMGPERCASTTFHEQRSLSARLHAAEGRDAQAILGHRHVAMTERYLDARGVEAVVVPA